MIKRNCVLLGMCKDRWIHTDHLASFLIQLDYLSLEGTKFMFVHVMITESSFSINVGFIGPWVKVGRDYQEQYSGTFN